MPFDYPKFQFHRITLMKYDEIRNPISGKYWWLSSNDYLSALYLSIVIHYCFTSYTQYHPMSYANYTSSKITAIQIKKANLDYNPVVTTIPNINTAPELKSCYMLPLWPDSSQQLELYLLCLLILEDIICLYIHCIPVYVSQYVHYNPTDRYNKFDVNINIIQWKVITSSDQYSTVDSYCYT